MKKIISLFAILLSSLIILSGCNDNDTANSNIMISVYLEGTDDNKSIEIYNNSLEEIKLNNYSIGIFKIGNKETPNINIKLSGILEAKKCYVISNDKANSNILAKTNLKTADLSFGGIEGVALMYKDTVLDVIGSIGLRNQNANMTLVRKVDCTTPSTTFDQYNYLRYGLDNANYLGEFKNSVTPEELLQGPKFDKSYLDLPFYTTTPGLLGTGGALEVELFQNVDGDTAYFVFPDSVNIGSLVAKNNTITKNGVVAAKVRYQDIDTPESYSGNIQEFGLVAKKYTSDLQTNADKIYVQTIKNDGLLCTYGRLMGYVFVEKDNDTTLVNFEVIKHGYSNIGFQYNEDMLYKDLPYYSYFLNAQLYAQKNKLGLYGEKDPNWDYKNNKSLYD